MGTVTTTDEELAYELLQQRRGQEGSLARGVLESTRMLERRKAVTVIIAANVVPSDRLDVVRSLCNQQGVRVLVVSDKKRLGEAAGLEVAASCVALSKAKSLR